MQFLELGAILTTLNHSHKDHITDRHYDHWNAVGHGRHFLCALTFRTLVPVPGIIEEIDNAFC